jgi:2-polyprenyl-3-methyl-5-hydroxy-6-metoxy-1,4-benzoquinol methylase
MSTNDYLMGRTAAETRRLEIQAELYAPHTDHLLRLAGLEAGMRVLDVGCGLGDVTLQAARLVGPTGHVTGADSNEDVLTVARQRAKESGLENVTFIQAQIPAIPVDGLVDAIIGRLILMHLRDPAAAVRALSALVRPGGIISFQEVDVAYGTSTSWSAPLAAKCMKWCADIALEAGSPIRGGQLAQILRDAGLDVAGMAVATPVAVSPDSPAYIHLAATVASLLPLIVAHDLATEAEVDIGTLLSRLRAEGRETGSTLYPPELIGAWARKGTKRLMTS